MKLKDWDDEDEQEEKRRPQKGSGQKEYLDFEDMEPEKPETEAADPEELAPLPVWAKALILLGLAVLAAIICAVLWRFVHPDSTQESQNGSSQTAEASGDPTDPSQLVSGAEGQPGASSGAENREEPDQNQETMSGTESGAATEPGEASVPESSGGIQNPGDGQTPGDSQTPVGSQTPGDSQTPAGNQNPGQDAASGSQSASQPENAGSQPSEGTAPSDGSGAGNQEPAGNAGMTFTSVQESVTPKDAVNLRTAPNTADDTNIVVKIQNGQTLARTGVNYDTGWSRIDYSGQTLYAVTQYLTTDLNYKTPTAPADPNRVTTAGGTVVIFENCDDWISPKEYVNLRTEPSTVQENATVSCQLNYGEKAHRTGYSEDFGWSRVEYNGQVLYVVTSFVYVVPADWTANGSN